MNEHIKTSNIGNLNKAGKDGKTLLCTFDAKCVLFDSFDVEFLPSYVDMLAFCSKVHNGVQLLLCNYKSLPCVISDGSPFPTLVSLAFPLPSSPKLCGCLKKLNRTEIFNRLNSWKRCREV